MAARSQSPDQYLASFQNAFRTELNDALRSLCPTDTIRVLDCPCGNGFYSAMLATHLRRGQLVAADNSAECLDRARAAVAEADSKKEVEFVLADTYALPFADGAFDLVWCAQSFITLDDPVRALREMRRVLRVGGQVLVLETDEYHHVLLPWPVDLELALFRAVRAESRVRYGTSGKFAQARRLRSAFLQAGLPPTGQRTVVADRVVPFAAADREFLTQHLRHLRSCARHELTPRELEQFDRVANSEVSDSLLNREDGELTCLATVCQALRVGE